MFSSQLAAATVNLLQDQGVAARVAIGGSYVFKLIWERFLAVSSRPHTLANTIVVRQ